MLNRRSTREINLMRAAGRCVAEAHQAVAKEVRPGVTTGELDAIVDGIFQSADAEPLFKGYPGPTPFPAATCISVNEAIVHGIPGDRQLVDGDVVSIDTGCRIDGWCGDAAVTHPVGDISDSAKQLLETTKAVLYLAIDLLDKRELWSQVAREMEEFVEGAGLTVIRQFVGHGIGREMHEKPDVPNFDSEELRERRDFRLKTGLVLAIEPMVCIGQGNVRCLDDQWTQVTEDGKYAAHFEHTVALTSDGPEILTK